MSGCREAPSVVGNGRKRVLAGFLMTAMLGAGPVRPASADTCLLKIVEGPVGSSTSCTVPARGFVIVIATGVVHVVITCDGAPYLDKNFGTTEVSGIPGPCLLAITITTTAGPALVAGSTF